MPFKWYYCGALAYADDITISCPSRRGLNRLLYICHTFALSNDITFSTKKTMCIKYGEPVKDSEKIILDRVQLKYCETVHYLGNFLTMKTMVQAISIINVLVL